MDFINLLDFELIAHPGPAFADVRRGNLRLLLAGPNSSAGRPMPDGSKPGPSGWNRIHLIVDDLDTEVSRLRPVPQRRRGAGKQILLQEPSGKVVELFQPGEPVTNPPQKRRR